ncbi:MAG: hypothetical protein J0H09_04025 [Burkholderiales bacterium]|nr:hypothetical protein [Burkholderiales bacterium]ODU52915.1 MAG: hypothetical protein ABT09_02300 [bacterium SCN 57-13]
MANANSTVTPVPSGGQPSPAASAVQKLSDQLSWAERLVSEVTEDIRAVAFGALEMLRSGNRIDCVYTSITIMAQMADTLASQVQSIAEDCGIEVEIDETAWNDASVAMRRWKAVGHAE